MEKPCKYIFTDRIYVESILVESASDTVTLIARIMQDDELSSPKHLFCTTGQLATLLLSGEADSDRVLSYITDLMAHDNWEALEKLPVELLLGRPLSITHRKLRLYHPLVQRSEFGPLSTDPDLLEIDLIMPRP